MLGFLLVEEVHIYIHVWKHAGFSTSRRSAYICNGTCYEMRSFLLIEVEVFVFHHRGFFMDRDIRFLKMLSFLLIEDYNIAIANCWVFYSS